MRAVLFVLSFAFFYFSDTIAVAMGDSIQDRRQFALHYSQLADTELLKLASEPWALSETAWEALEDELDHRDLEVPEPESSLELGQPDMRHLVLLRRFRDTHEALLAKGRLDACGVECFLADENMVRMDWFISNLLGGVKLLVAPADFSRASRLLNDPLSLQLDRNELD